MRSTTSILLSSARILLAVGVSSSVVLGCADAPSSSGRLPNILFLILDDVGTELIRAYSDTPAAAITPTIDALAAEGVLFRKAWATPMCSPTRASILTGTLPSTHGVGNAISTKHAARQGGLDLSRGLVTLPQLLKGRGYESFVAGKWHLGPGKPIAPRHALSAGFDHHSGTYANLGGRQGYVTFEKYVDGVREIKTGYATSDTVDDAIRFISEAEAPWFGWVAFNAIHVPLHAPPGHLHTVDVDGELGSSRRRARAMVQAVDTEIGRLLSSMGEEERARTIVVFLSDNGSGKRARGERGRFSKGSVFEAGLNVPLIVSGSVVAEPARGSESDALVHVLDLFATAAEWSGAMLPEHSESVSLHPYLRDSKRDSLRPVVFTELLASNGGPPAVAGHDRAVRDARYKLVDRSGTRSFFDLQADPAERNDLLKAPPVGSVARRLRRLETALELRGSPGLLAESPPSS